MAKITLNPISGSYASVTAINARLQQIEDVFNNDVLWRGGFIGEPNAMSVDFDMAGFNLMNANLDWTSSTIEAVAYTQSGVPVLDLSDQSWLGGKVVEPTTRNDGVSALVEGDAYYNNVTNVSYTYDGVVWNSLTAIAASLAVDTSIGDAGGYYTGVEVETALQEAAINTNTVSTDLGTLSADVDKLYTTANGEGASLIGLEDAGGDFTATDVEGALAEIGSQAKGSITASYVSSDIDITGIPSWANKLTLVLSSLSSTSTNHSFRTLLGTSSGLDTTSDYSSSWGAVKWSGVTTGNYNNAAAGWIVGYEPSGSSWNGVITIEKLSGNTWVMSGQIHGESSDSGIMSMAGKKVLSGVLDRLQVHVFSSGVFTSGTITCYYEK